MFPARSNHSRGYSSEGGSKYNRPMRQFAEENEANPQPLIYYVVVCYLSIFPHIFVSIFLFFMIISTDLLMSNWVTGKFSLCFLCAISFDL